MTKTYHIDVISRAGVVVGKVNLCPPHIGYCWSRRRGMYEVTLITSWGGQVTRPIVYVSADVLKSVLMSRFDKLCGYRLISRADVRRLGFKPVISKEERAAV